MNWVDPPKIQDEIQPNYQPHEVEQAVKASKQRACPSAIRQHKPMKGTCVSAELSRIGCGAERQDHFMNPDLLGSQFQTSQEPLKALTFDIFQQPEAIISAIRSALRL